jgi:mannose-6-phosphate isomerase-like protein (cupin superfamily)
MTISDWIFSLQHALAQLPDDPGAPRAHYVIRHGTMRAGIYAPVERDTQTPHTQDELYIVISGTGEVINDGERRSFAPQDVIFVKAGAEHRFENFSDDFATWVVFWGPKGGES